MNVFERKYFFSHFLPFSAIFQSSIANSFINGAENAWDRCSTCWICNQTLAEGHLMNNFDNNKRSIFSNYTTIFSLHLLEALVQIATHLFFRSFFFFSRGSVSFQTVWNKLFTLQNSKVFNISTRIKTLPDSKLFVYSFDWINFGFRS